MARMSTIMTGGLEGTSLHVIVITPFVGHHVMKRVDHLVRVDIIIRQLGPHLDQVNIADHPLTRMQTPGIIEGAALIAHRVQTGLKARTTHRILTKLFLQKIIMMEKNRIGIAKCASQNRLVDLAVIAIT
jgi:hypothetical protein